MDPFEVVVILVVLVLAGRQVILGGANRSPRYVLIHEAFRSCPLPTLTARRLMESDHALCIEWYRELIDAGLTPASYEEDFPDWLADPNIRKWAFFSNGVQVSYAGLSFWPEHRVASLSYGLMGLEHRGKGLGSLALAYRLRAIPAEEPCFVTIWATDHSREYYRRFGFEEYDSGNLPEEEACPDLHSMGVWLRTADQAFLAEYLAQHPGLDPQG